MRHIRRLIPFGLFLLASVFAGCGNHDSSSQAVTDKLVVATGMAPVANLIHELGGDKVDVRVLLATGEDPEQFDPGTATMKALAQSRIFFTLGILPFEERIAANIGQGQTDVVSVTDSLIFIYGTHGNEPDPHVWMSLRNQKSMAASVTRALIDADPGHRDYFMEKLSGFFNRVDSLDAAWSQQLARVKGKAFVIGHPALSYFARDYAMQQISMASEGHKEQSALQMRRLLDRAKNAAVSVIFSQPGNDSRFARELSEHLDAKVVPLDPMKPETFSELATAVDALADSCNPALPEQP